MSLPTEERTMGTRERAFPAVTSYLHDYEEAQLMPTMLPLKQKMEHFLKSIIRLF